MRAIEYFIEEPAMNPSRKWLARLIVTMNLLVACVLIFGQRSTTMTALVEQSGAAGYTAITALAGVGLLALLDLLVNDFLPARFELRFSLRYRHTIYMLISLGCLSMIFVTIKTFGVTLDLLHYSLVAWAALVIALLDIRERYKGPL